MMRKLKMISGPLRETSFIAITWNPELKCTYRKKKLFFFRWSTSTFPDTPTHDLMYRQRKILMITGTLEKENYQIHGMVSKDSLKTVKTTGWIYMVRGDTDKKAHDLKAGHCMALMHRNAKRSKRGQSRNQSSTMPEDGMVFTSLILMMRNSNV